MKKFFVSVSAILCIAVYANAQSVEDGIKLMYYGKYTSAVASFQKTVAANPKDGRSIYWLGQAYLAKDDFQGAKSLYQKALSDGINDPWIWVGMGHVQLLDGKGDIPAAKQNFEQAITSSKGKKNENPDILDAVGRANADGSSLQGDAAYGVDVLSRAAAIDLKNPDIDLNLGICYLKQGSDQGGHAVQAFQDAITRDSKYAAAYTRIGKVYESQDNKEFMMQWFDKAIAADPSYGPAYLQYFLYYEERDVNQAKVYLDKWVANSDQDCQSAYFVADYYFRAGNPQESLNRAKAMDNSDCKSYPFLNLLYAVNYDKLGDSVQATMYLNKFFTAVSPDKIISPNYAVAATIYSKVAGNDSLVSKYMQLAIDNDTVIAHKINYTNQAAELAGNSGNLSNEIHWMGKLATLKGGSISEADYYKLGNASLKSVMMGDTSYMQNHDTVTIMNNFMLADSINKAYITAYPTKPQGYSFRVLSAKTADYDSTKGIALEAIKQQNDYFAKDTSVSAKKNIYLNDYYLLIYYAQYQKSMSKIDGYRKAIDIASQMQALYPDPADENNQFATKTKNQLQSVVDKYEKSGSKSSSGSSKSPK